MGKLHDGEEGNMFGIKERTNRMAEDGEWE